MVVGRGSFFLLRLVVTMRPCGGVEVRLGGRRWLHGSPVWSWLLWQRWVVFGSGVRLVLVSSRFLGLNRRLRDARTTEVAAT